MESPGTPAAADRRQDFSFLLDRMKEDHLAEVMEIEKVSFRTPWPTAGFVTEMKREYSKQWVVLATPRDGRPGTVVAGYDVYWRLFDEIHLLNIAAHPEFRGMGVATMMMDDLMQEARRSRVRRITLEVRMSNRPALALYNKYGFRSIGLRRGYYADTGEDALIMARDLG